MKPLMILTVTSLLSLACGVAQASPATPPHRLEPNAPRSVTVSEAQTPPVIRAGLLQSTLILLPAEEKIATVFGGDTVDWVFDGGHVASRFISVKPKLANTTTDIHIVSDHGNEYPLLAERERYIEYLLRRGTGVKYIRVTASYMERIVEVMGLTQLRSITRSEIEEASAAWIDPQCPYRIRGSHHGLSPSSFRRVAAGWFSFLGELETTLLPSFEWMIQAFMSSRNVTSLTADRYGWRVRTFFRFLREPFDIQGISLAEIDAFVTAKLALGWKLHSIIGHCRTLRDFFHFAGAQGWCESNFYLGIRIPRLISRPIEPKAPEWSEVSRLLRSFQKPTASDRRAKAMVMLCALYGLRSIEVFRLELGDIDWRNATFVVRRAKRGGIQHFPLLHEVGEAILDYLKNGRPKSPSRLLFLSMRPPYGKVSSTSLWRAVGPPLRDIGSRVDYVGAHCLRHACATRLLRKGASLQQIADFLGHRNVRSVDTYARLDMRSLRKVAAFSFSELT